MTTFEKKLLPGGCRLKLARGNMWTTYADCYVVTTNQYVTVKGKLVMGRGAAWQARDMFPGLDINLGILINHYAGTPYSLLCAGKFMLPPPHSREAAIWAFQVKTHFRDEARLDLIQSSSRALTAIAKHDKNLIWHLNFPGIGNGRLNRKDVLPLLQDLPDNVTVWEL